MEERCSRVELQRDEMLLGCAATEAATRGWSVVPLHSVHSGRCSCGDPECPAPGKHPRIAWRRYIDDAADIDEVHAWWRRWPRANIGVVTGAVSGLVVLDVDPRNDGTASLEELESSYGPLSPTVESLTGGGGRHLYFRHPGGVVASRTVASGLDVKGDGGLVVSPPSSHASGRHYAWKEGSSPGEIPVAALPEWFEQLMVEARSSLDLAPGADRPLLPRTEQEREEFAELWSAVGIELHPGDHNYLCPFHPDHHPSLHIDTDGCRFYCFGCGLGGGSGRLRRLVGQTPPATAHEHGHVAPEATDEQRAPTLSGDREIRVVGESRCQDALLALAGGHRGYASAHLERVARLVPEPDNPIDRGAIAVTIAGQRVGYLSREDAARYRAAITAAIEREREASCAAVIVGGWERAHGDVGHFGVRLHLGAVEGDPTPAIASGPARPSRTRRAQPRAQRRNPR